MPSESPRCPVFRDAPARSRAVAREARTGRITGARIIFVPSGMRSISAWSSGVPWLKVCGEAVTTVMRHP